ncbi:HDOD domain-containing protein [Aliiglaciecola sp. CAU 1673]|uniref:EAL and HDOD domain-containing protein n=1 Tax=Aliiglaciecola sp. CAU 1673 TaxID=3032595 RepID=UPI0023DA55DB|nr:HDOD domain-containing protein [Aliiglaciecola sp. CAU 1673]MDF2178084.1 HDOD domain-containing protein [Aliiglaciecola sp. CAU 1673]
MAFFAARQPILDKDKKLFAYELLFRESLENVFPNIEDNLATSKIVEGLQFNLGLDTLTDKKPAFINFTQDTLINRYPLLLPKEQVVVEILETARPTRSLLNACKELKSKGYLIALDDYEHQGAWQHFYPYIDIIKIDFRATPVKEILAIKRVLVPFPHIKLLAEKVETHEEYRQALDLGFCYFQGYFFSKPEVLQSRVLNPSQLTVARIMSELSGPDPDINAVTDVFEKDVNLSFKLLRYTQSPIFKRSNDISSIKQAIVVLGLQELRRFVSLLFAAQFADNKPVALTVMSLIRARFMESLASEPGQPCEPASAFLTGILSLLDALLDSPLPELLDKLPITSEIKDALCQDKGRLATYLNLVKCFEEGLWSEGQVLAKELNVEMDKVSDIYVEALSWVSEREGMG